MSKGLNKRQFRTEVFKGIFELDFYNEEYKSEQLELLYDENTHPEGVTVTEKDAEEVKGKCDDIIKNLDAIDKRIEDSLDKWTINRIGKVELAILRVAVYEYDYDKLEAPIVINEAVEIAKVYGGDKSGSFVNGVMAKIVK